MPLNYYSGTSHSKKSCQARVNNMENPQHKSRLAGQLLWLYIRQGGETGANATTFQQPAVLARGMRTTRLPKMAYYCVLLDKIQKSYY